MEGRSPYRTRVYPPQRLIGIKRSIGSLSAPPLNRYEAVLLTTTASLSRRSSLAPDIRNEASQEIRTQFLSTAKACERLDWKPLHTMQEGLLETVHWYRSYLSSAAVSWAGKRRWRGWHAADFGIAFRALAYSAQRA
jgi:hypothetical protein